MTGYYAYLTDWKEAADENSTLNPNPKIAGTALASLLGGFVCIGYDVSTEKRAKPKPGKTVITILEPHTSPESSASARNMSFVSSR